MTGRQAIDLHEKRETIYVGGRVWVAPFPMWIPVPVEGTGTESWARAIRQAMSDVLYARDSGDGDNYRHPHTIPVDGDEPMTRAQYEAHLDALAAAIHWHERDERENRPRTSRWCGIDAMGHAMEGIERAGIARIAEVGIDIFVGPEKV